MKKSSILVAILFAVFSCKTPVSKNTLDSFTPGTIWPDNKGKHINAHGGGIIKVDERYYWFGEHKITGPEGNKAMVGVSCYSSEDLFNWRDEGIALAVAENDTTNPIAKGCVLERPKVIYNAKNNRYVMWFHLELRDKGYSAAMTGVAVSKKVTGPYTFVKALRPNANTWPVKYPDSLKTIKHSNEGITDWSPEWMELIRQGFYLQRDFKDGQMSRDMTLYLDDNGKAYHIHSSEDNLTLHISELTDDFLDFSGKYYRIFPGGHNEAPALFKHNNKYFMITSGCTGWDPNAARLAMADSIEGNWIYLGNPCTGTDSALTYHAQSTFILPVEKDQFIFMADRWNPKDPIDGCYIWLPVRFREKGIPYLEWLDEWDLED
jgi:hypothetical protein